MGQLLLSHFDLLSCAHSPANSYPIWFSSVIIGSGLGQEYHHSDHMRRSPTFDIPRAVARSEDHKLSHAIVVVIHRDRNITVRTVGEGAILL